VTAAGVLFFPQSKSLGIDQGGASPAILEKIAYAGTVAPSFAQASAALQRLADLPIPEKQAERVTERIGGERLAERAAEGAAYQALPLAARFGVPEGAVPPDLAVLMADGGRMQVLGRRPPAAGPAADQGPAAPAPAAALGPPSGHWREDKVGLLLRMHSAVSDHDPCPEIPGSFVDPGRIPKLVRELKRGVPETADGAADSDEPEAADEALRASARYQAPEVQQRQVVASSGSWRSFAPLLAAAAWAWGFQGAARRAFVGDGSANNWRLQRRFFGSFVPILDFIHALSYVFAAAMAGRGFAAGWGAYEQWIGWVWQGQVARVIAALEGRQGELGLPEKGEAETNPRQVVARTLTYLRNHQDKMRYDEYRRQGLPITSSLIESVVKQVNQRVKGTEKFWSEGGGEAVLQLRADYLSDGEPMQAFWQRRQAQATGQRRYRRAG
jgi:hypothetical protein